MGLRRSVEFVREEAGIVGCQGAPWGPDGGRGAAQQHGACHCSLDCTLCFCLACYLFSQSTCIVLSEPLLCHQQVNLSLLYIKKPVYCHGSVLWGTQRSSRYPQRRLVSGNRHHSVDREAKYHLQKFPRLPKMCFHHIANRQYFIPLLKYSQHISMPNAPFLTWRSSNYA